MARPGISRQDVFTAADQLAAQGKAPTIEQIRHILKTGSNSTIANHLRDWRAIHSDSQLALDQQGLPSEMVVAMRHLWEKMQAHSQVRAQESEHRQHDDIASLQAEVQKYKANNQKWQQMFNQWLQEKVEIENEKASLLQAVNDLQKSLEQLEVNMENQARELASAMQQAQHWQNLFKEAEAKLEIMLKSNPNSSSR